MSETFICAINNYILIYKTNKTTPERFLAHIIDINTNKTIDELVTSIQIFKIGDNKNRHHPIWDDSCSLSILDAYKYHPSIALKLNKIIKFTGFVKLNKNEIIFYNADANTHTVTRLYADENKKTMRIKQFGGELCKKFTCEFSEDSFDMSYQKYSSKTDDIVPYIRRWSIHLKISYHPEEVPKFALKYYDFGNDIIILRNYPAADITYIEYIFDDHGNRKSEITMGGKLYKIGDTYDLFTYNLYGNTPIECIELMYQQHPNNAVKFNKGLKYTGFVKWNDTIIFYDAIKETYILREKSSKGSDTISIEKNKILDRMFITTCTEDSFVMTTDSYSSDTDDITNHIRVLLIILVTELTSHKPV